MNNLFGKDGPHQPSQSSWQINFHWKMWKKSKNWIEGLFYVRSTDEAEIIFWNDDSVVALDINA